MPSSRRRRAASGGPLYGTNAGPILDIGHGTFLNTGGCYYTNRYFDGKIDELEIFTRELSGAEISNLYQAGSSGKCKVRCYLPRYVPFCKNQNQRLTTLAICNQTTMSTSFNWSMYGLASGAGCNFNGTGMTFSPANCVTPILAPGQCVSIPVTIFRPAVFVTGSIACYGVTVMDPFSGATSTCHGAIVATNKWCPIIVDPTLSPLKVGQAGVVTFTVGYNSDTPGNLAYRIEAVGGKGDPDAQVISLNGLPPEVPVEDNIAADPGQSTPISVTVTLTELVSLDTPEIILSVDVEDDGVPDRVMSAGIEPVLFPDCNGNGVDDALDVAGGSSLDANGDLSTTVGDAVYLISYIFKGGAAPTPYAKCSGDANSDCAVNVGDAVYMVAYVFKGGLPPVSCDEWVTACGKPLR